MGALRVDGCGWVGISVPLAKVFCPLVLQRTTSVIAAPWLYFSYVYDFFPVLFWKVVFFASAVLFPVK